MDEGIFSTELSKIETLRKNGDHEGIISLLNKMVEDQSADVTLACILADALRGAGYARESARCFSGLRNAVEKSETIATEDRRFLVGYINHRLLQIREVLTGAPYPRATLVAAAINKVPANSVWKAHFIAD
jgi:hypothetical protein